MDTFNPSAFKRLKQVEKKHFWFNVRRRYIFDAVSHFCQPPAKILEIGCGTGNVSSYLAGKGYKVTGCEYFPQALELAYDGFTKVRGDAFSLPFKEKSFDIVGLFDVIEHFDDDRSILTEAKRVIKPGGIIVITVPAREELWHYFDIKAHHKRRYSKVNLKSLLSSAGFATRANEYMFSLLYIPIMLNKKKTEDSDKFKINPVINTLFRAVFEAERIISRIIPLPAGTSLIAIGTRDDNTLKTAVSRQ
ncbi:MAG: class I SAM-dependent methyltransferase [Nitrospirae bacterium]|nr:class I SAM-dependent methyltransferase [Nitrospirota bacterium]